MRQVNGDPAKKAVNEAWRAHRPYLVDLAFRMLGDIGAAEDIVQEAFTRLLLARVEEIEDERGWLIVVTSRLCFDLMKSARARREQVADAFELDRRPAAASVDPADRITLDDNVRLALVVVLQRLSPAERVVFVLHDVFRMPFDMIAETVGRTSASCRQLARRARQKVDVRSSGAISTAEAAEHHEIVERFISACSTGQVEELISLLDPGASGSIDIRPDIVVIGSEQVARNLIRFWSSPATTLVSQPAGGLTALLGFVDRELAGILLLTIEEGRVQEIHAVADPTMLDLVRAQLSLTEVR
jgi:RNA polymerase sigma-70 factor (ECF subfamily)